MDGSVIFVATYFLAAWAAIVVFFRLVGFSLALIARQGVDNTCIR